jgi:hypothetical protein
MSKTFFARLKSGHRYYLTIPNRHHSLCNDWTLFGASSKFSSSAGRTLLYFLLLTLLLLLIVNVLILNLLVLSPIYYRSMEQSILKLKPGLSMDEANQLENAIFTKFTAASIPFKHFVLWDILQERTICPPIVEKPDPTDYGVTRSLEDIKKLSASELTQFEMFRKLYVHKEEEYLRALELSRQFTLAEQTGLGILRSFFHEDI